MTERSRVIRYRLWLTGLVIALAWVVFVFSMEKHPDAGIRFAALAPLTVVIGGRLWLKWILAQQDGAAIQAEATKARIMAGRAALIATGFIVGVIYHSIRYEDRSAQAHDLISGEKDFISDREMACLEKLEKYEPKPKSDWRKRSIRVD